MSEDLFHVPSRTCTYPLGRQLPEFVVDVADLLPKQGQFLPPTRRAPPDQAGQMALQEIKLHEKGVHRRIRLDGLY